MNRTGHRAMSQPDSLFSLNAIIAMILPLTMLVQFKIVGTLFMQDIVSPILLMLLILDSRNRAMLMKLSIVWLLLGLWLIGVVATDLFRHTAPNDLARGWSRLLLLSINIGLVWIVCGRSARFVAIYGIGTGMALILQPYVNPGEFSGDDPWKFGVGMGCMLVVAAFSAFPVVARTWVRYLPVIGLVVLSAISLALNTRTIFGIGMLTAIFTCVAEWTSSKRQGKPLPSVALIAIVVIGALFATVIFNIYGYAAGSGLLGDAARAKYLVQSSADVSLLLAGRSESLASIQAIKDSPLLGHGSWAVDPYYTLLWFTKMRELGIDPTASEYRFLPGQAGFVIPSHSYLLGSWVEAGILSAPFWIWAVLLGLRAVYGLLLRPRLPAPLVTLCALLVTWDVLFSPFSAEARIIKAYQIVVLILAVLGNGGSLSGLNWPRRKAPATGTATTYPARATVPSRLV